nr:ribonuclease H-like domain, reverse transcriptase, RNA-dependent DNA polymerase [Tanacetum cinerariifolium]
MTNLTFADMHNMVAFLSKSDASAGFDQILDFLNAHVIQYALMVNPTIYVSCIKQFYALATIKKVNDVVKLRALIDGKRVEIFTELARMGYEKPPPKLTFYKAFFSAQWKFLIHTLVQCVSAKRTVWNEFSCSMASPVICLATGREFNFSKYIFDSMVRNVDSPSKFLMYLRFLQVIINAQVDDLSSHNKQYTSPALTQKGRKDDDSAAKEVSVAEPTVFDDEEVTMTMAQILIKIKAEKARLLDEKYQSLKRKPISIAQARKNMIIYLKNTTGYKMEHFRGSHSTQDTLTSDPKEMSEEDIKNMLEIVPVSEFKVEALQVKYPLIDWEIHYEGSRSYWKIIKRSSDEDFHAGQETKEQKFGYILQVIKKLKLKKLDGLLAKVDVVQRLEEKALRD